MFRSSKPKFSLVTTKPIIKQTGVKIKHFSELWIENNLIGTESIRN